MALFSCSFVPSIEVVSLHVIEVVGLHVKVIIFSTMHYSGSSTLRPKEAEAWRVGHGYIRETLLIVLSLREVTRDVWQPEFFVPDCFSLLMRP